MSGESEWVEGVFPEAVPVLGVLAKYGSAMNKYLIDITNSKQNVSLTQLLQS